MDMYGILKPGEHFPGLKPGMDFWHYQELTCCAICEGKDGPWYVGYPHPPPPRHLADVTGLAPVCAGCIESVSIFLERFTQ